MVIEGIEELAKMLSIKACATLPFGVYLVLTAPAPIRDETETVFARSLRKRKLCWFGFVTISIYNVTRDFATS